MCSSVVERLAVRAQQALIDAQRAYLDRYRTMWSAIVEMRNLLLPAAEIGDSNG